MAAVLKRPVRRLMTILVRQIMAGLAIVAMVVTVEAADRGTTRFWNLTGETITHLYLAQSGTKEWSADQCRNDRDGTVDFDERLPITGISSGLYDVRFTDKTGRNCIVKGVAVKAGAVFSIDKEMAGHCAGE